MITQKTWKDLLGPYTENDKVDGRYIVRHLGGGHYKILWSFDNKQQAIMCFNEWKKQ